MNKLVLLVLFVLCIGCESSVLNYAKTRYPDCSVKQKEELPNGIVVVVKCPQEDPFYKTFRAK